VRGLRIIRTSYQLDAILEQGAPRNDAFGAGRLRNRVGTNAYALDKPPRANSMKYLQNGIILGRSRTCLNVLVRSRMAEVTSSSLVGSTTNNGSSATENYRTQRSLSRDPDLLTATEDRVSTYAKQAASSFGIVCRMLYSILHTTFREFTFYVVG